MSDKMREALTAYRTAQRRMLDKWSESDEAVKQRLWRDLHACEAVADEVLAEQPEQSVPDGMVLVPIKPTLGMVSEGCDAIRNNGGDARWSDMPEAWAAMLAAAPKVKP